MEYKKIDGGDLGVVLLKRNPRARNYSLRVDKGQVYATMPVYGSECELLDFLNQQHERLLRMLEKSPGHEIFDESTELHFLTFDLRIIKSERENFYSVIREGVLYISCPLHTDFSDREVQGILRGLLEHALRYEAKRVLPARVAILAQGHGFKYASVKINNSRTHWGSCTSRKNINLSLSVMLLPAHLVDYILLHELCHTVELNHSERFWALMDKVTEGKTGDYRNELKNYRMIL
ncbi:MAG: M48 family metallopeptidase [Tannerella sp.]|jgi:predicted metal-dependent hydrolase|nr:M48 family metallopeptidase [Tannerella sp.]